MSIFKEVTKPQWRIMNLTIAFSLKARKSTTVIGSVGKGFTETCNNNHSMTSEHLECLEGQHTSWFCVEDRKGNYVLRDILIT